jgi:CRISPR-associated protein Cmr2
MMRHVLIVVLGPVQDFISTARRCRDLWFGSWVLSELAKAAAASIVDALGGERALSALVFPAPEGRAALDPASDLSVANKLVVRVEGGEARVRAVAEKGHDGMRARLDEIRDDAFGRVGKYDERRVRHFLHDPATAQVGKLFEYTWAAALEGEGEGAYAKARLEAERLLAARKATRAWEQPAWGVDGVPKCSLCGVRESVIHEDLYERPVTGPARPPAIPPEPRRTGYGIRGDERLCGACLLKRWGRTTGGARAPVERFFSTAHLAALPRMIGADADKARRPAIEGAWQALRLAAKEAVEAVDVVPGRRTGIFGQVDGAVLFPARLRETFEDLGHDRRSERVAEALAAQRDLLRHVGEPLSYYAILVADGDGMGEHIRELNTHEAHRDLSRKLDSFARSGLARSARGIVDTHDGCLVYSGGDDVLAFLPLHRALECALALAQRFHDETGATLSAGLAVVHYTDPMGAALEVARDAEKHAKAYPRKSALAVALDKRSGGRTIARGHWDPLVPRLLDLVALHRADAIPDKAGYELAALARLAEEVSQADLPRIRRIQQSEALRILARKRAAHGKEKLAVETLERLSAHIGENPATLGDEIAIAGVIAQAKDQAAPADEEGA